MKLKIRLVKETSASTERSLKEWPIEIIYFKNGTPKLLVGVPSEGTFKRAIRDEIDDTRQTNS
jgi:hypothetical protein